ncbi:EscU/YscU/HrcU family type III secretion system export apparatus switch protein [Nocardioides oleivorans]|uniref:EscU/YscU/HrcU family type III secretion system export apparatus switch protein n=1 Tax=Nocardioides oleivorans TaxID=273676 RepID=A0A4Q2S1Q3_9ACTN|nr:EscU/YscU/HrcU family type III secretion system export apparatus switch protein [Nocardioides oleivorans]RYB94249.1 EscU/YscU/HrcU family type III secretion system export apparatus switch protein [Nocardioides oleivorans]
MSEEKTEKPTAKKRRESRKEGQVPRTQELGGWATLLIVGMLLPGLLGRELTALAELMRDCFSLRGHVEVADATTLLGRGARHVMVTLVTLGCAVMVVGVAAALAQGGFFMATKSVKPSLKKLDPIQGFKRVFGTQALWEGAKMLLKSAVVGFVAYGAVVALMPLIGGLVPISAVLEVVHERVLALLRSVAVAGLVMAVADYAVIRRRMGKKTRMSKHEVKQESKQSDGDPLLKGAIRSRQLAASRNRMMADIAHADVVLVNPTHVAVALRYDAERGAPRVVARGAGVVAQKIRERAAEHRVPLVRDVPLARALHRSTVVGQEIPAELYAAVAQVLAFVISRRTAGVRGGEHRSPRTEVDLPVLPGAGRRRRTTHAGEAAEPNPSGVLAAGR